MEYKDKRCPVCGVPFDDNDDIVVCPECGTPQHRVCYERLGKCANAEKHGADFSWDKEEEQDLSICPSCGAKNPKDAMFCSACSHPLGNDASREQGQDARSSRPFGSSGNPQGVPFGFGSFDPSAVYSNLGISMGDEVAPGVTMSDCESYIKNNSLYYLPVFNNIKRFGRSRFNLSSALFSGAWFLYRKLYLVGSIILLIIAGCFVTEAFFINDFIRTFSEIRQTLGAAAGSVQIVNYAFNNLETSELIKFLLPCIANIVMFVTMFICGLTGNRIYFNHTVKIIKKTKDSKPSSLKEALGKVGGVNTVAAVVVMVCYVAFNFIIRIM